MNAQPVYDEVEPARGFWARLRDGLLGTEEPEDEEEGQTVANPTVQQHQGRSAASLRLQATRTGRVAVRLNAQVFEDAKVAADGLKNGEHQVVNLERATPQMAERIIDFLNGVIYALDGKVERVGDRVYMFVPANVAVEVDTTGATPMKRSSYSEGYAQG